MDIILIPFIFEMALFVAYIINAYFKPQESSEWFRLKYDGYIGLLGFIGISFMWISLFQYFILVSLFCPFFGSFLLYAS